MEMNMPYLSKGNYIFSYDLVLILFVSEAFEIDGFGLVQYFVSRCEFGKPQSNNI